MARKKFVKKYLKKVSSITEPEIAGDTSLSSVLSWYHQTNFEPKMMKQWVIDYSGEKKLKNVDEKLFTHPLTSICRVASRGFEITDKQKQHIEVEVARLVTTLIKKKAERQEKTVDKPTIQDRMKEQVSPVLAEIDFFVDEKLQGRENEITPLLTGLGAPQTKLVINYILDYFNEFGGVRDAKETDKELFNAYGLSIRELNSIVKYLDGLVLECQKWIDANKSTVRKTRKKKIKTPEQLCVKVQVSKDTVVKPTKIIGKQVAVLYNSKYNKLRYLVAVDGDGLSIKGTTVTGFSEIKSQMYTVKTKYRDKFLKSFAEGKIDGINKMKREIKSEKYKESKGKINGRINEETTILFVA